MAYEQPSRTQIHLQLSGASVEMLSVFNLLQDALRAHGSIAIHASSGVQSPTFQMEQTEYGWESSKLLTMRCSATLCPQKDAEDARRP